MIKSVNIKAIRIDGGTQSREKLDQAIVDEYAELMKEGTEFPPISVVYDGTEYYLSDGFHRLLAAQRSGKASINCDVLTGTLRDAILYSLSANASHGLRRTLEDRRKAVMTMLEDFEWSEWSDREIARQCHVSHPFVAKMRAAMKPKEKESGKITTPKAEKKAEPKVEEPQTEEHDPTKEVIDELVERNAELEKRLAVELMEATPEEKQKAKDLIEELQEQVKQLTIENQALSVSRDTFQAENAQLKRQVKMLQKKLKDAGIE